MPELCSGTSYTPLRHLFQASPKGTKFGNPPTVALAPNALHLDFTKETSHNVSFKQARFKYACFREACFKLISLKPCSADYICVIPEQSLKLLAHLPTANPEHPSGLWIMPSVGLWPRKAPPVFRCHFFALWLSVTLCGSLWLSLFVALCGSLWLSLSLCGSLWLLVDPYGSLWLIMALRGSLWLIVPRST